MKPSKLLALCLVPACSVVAQSGTNEVSTLPDVVVQGQSEQTDTYTAEEATAATRLPERLLDTPRSVQVVTEQVLDDRAIIDPQEAVQNISGVQRVGSRTGVGETYNIRGFRQGSLFKDGFRAGELSGGAVFTFEGPTDVANLERIEVLKGPSAILYGRGEPGGTVNYVTRTPQFSNHLSLQQQVGSYDFYRTEAHGNWHALPDRLALGLDASYENTGSFIDHVEGERFLAAPAAKWQIGPDTTLTFRSEYVKDDRSTTLALPYENGRVIPSPYDRYYGEPGFTEIESETWRGLLQLDHDWNENHSTVVSLHGAQNEAAGGNFILYNFNGGPLQNPVTGDISRSAEAVDFEGEYFTARLDHIWKATIYEGGDFPEVNNRLLASAEFDRQTTDGERILSGHTPLNPLNPVYTGYSPRPLFEIPGLPIPTTFTEGRTTDADATSILLLDRVSFGDWVHLSFGGRYEWFDANSASTFPATVPFPSSDIDLTEETFNPTVGLVVKPIRNLSLFGNYSESTHSFQNIASSTVTGDPLDAEQSRQYETGAKLEFLEGKLFTTVSLFQIEKSDVAATDPANPFFVINAGEERSRGVEFDLGGEILPGWRVIANYAYIDARVTDDPMGVTTDNRLPGVPEHSGGLFTVYEFQDGLLKGLGFGAGSYLSDRTKIDRANSGDLSGWVQTDALVYYKWKQLRAQLNVKNLFDNEFYYAGSFGFEVQRAPSRTFIAALKYEF